MSDIRVANRLRRAFPARNIGALVQLLMGVSVTMGQMGGAGTVSFFQSRTHIDPALLGLGFILGGLITLIARRARVYLAVNLFIFGSYALIGLLGWLFYSATPAEESILAMGVCLFTLWSFPEGDDVA